MRSRRLAFTTCTLSPLVQPMNGFRGGVPSTTLRRGSSNRTARWNARRREHAARFSAISLPHLLRTIFLEAQMLAEKRHHVILEAIGHSAGMRAVIDLEAVREPIFVENVMQLAGIDA